MVKVTIGPKGSGKTGRLIDRLNQYAENEAANVVLIEHGRRLDRQINHRIRLVEITEYPVEGYEQLLSFLAGITTMDYDITDIYIDSLFKVASCDCAESCGRFLSALEAFSQKQNLTFHVVISLESDEIPQTLKSYEQNEF